MNQNSPAKVPGPSNSIGSSSVIRNVDTTWLGSSRDLTSWSHGGRKLQLIALPGIVVGFLFFFFIGLKKVNAKSMFARKTH